LRSNGVLGGAFSYTADEAHMATLADDILQG
jgi:hypothetical protein